MRNPNKDLFWVEYWKAPLHHRVTDSLVRIAPANLDFGGEIQ